MMNYYDALVRWWGWSSPSRRSSWRHCFTETLQNFMCILWYKRLAANASVITFRAKTWSFGSDSGCRQAAKLSEVPSLLQQSRISMATFHGFCSFADLFPRFGWVLCRLQELMELKKNGGCSTELDGDTNIENRVSFSGDLVTSKDWVWPRKALPRRFPRLKQLGCSGCWHWLHFQFLLKSKHLHNWSRNWGKRQHGCYNLQGCYSQAWGCRCPCCWADSLIALFLECCQVYSLYSTNLLYMFFLQENPLGDALGYLSATFLLILASCLLRMRWMKNDP